MPVISSLHIYPVKSLQGITVPHATLTPRGLQYDRHWMLVDGDGQFVTQRQLPALARISVRLNTEHLILEYTGLPPLCITLAAIPAQRRHVKVWDDHCSGCDEGDVASAWLTQAVGQWQGQDLRLVRFAPDSLRPVDPAYMDGANADTEFSDGYPFLVTNEASLTALNAHLQTAGASPVPMARFRPNIVLRDMPAWAENQTKTLAAQDGSYALTFRKPCKRCKITTVDQQTGLIADPQEPLRILAALQHYPHRTGAYFGQNATLDSGAGVTIRVGNLLHPAWVKT